MANSITNTNTRIATTIEDFFKELLKLLDQSDAFEKDSLFLGALKKDGNAPEVDYLTLSGGTGAAWYPYFKERLSGFETLNIIPCNRNDDISYIFSNVRGYYLYRINIG